MPNPQAIVDKAADGYLNNGVLGLTCIFLILLLVVLGLVIRHLDKKNEAQTATILAITGSAIKAIEGSEDALEDLTAAMKGVQNTLETRGQAVGELSHQVELQGREASHKLANLSQAVSMIAEAVRRSGTGGAP